MSTTRQRRQARADQLSEWSDKRAANADAGFAQADAMAGVIPFGQPILAGHHSEGRDRRYRAGVRSTEQRAVEDDRKAKAMAAKADNIEDATGRSVFADDPDAVEALRVRIARLDEARKRIRAYNASCRRGERNTGLLDAEQQALLVDIAKVTASQLGPEGQMPGYVAANLGGRIAADRKRVASLVAS